MLYDPKWKPQPTDIKLQPWQEAMLKAADIIEEKGWVQHSYGNAYTGYCIMGALMTSVQDDPIIRKAVSTAANKFCFINGVDPARFNDAPNRTKEEVIKAMRDTAYAL